MDSWPTTLPLPVVSSALDVAPRGGLIEMESGRVRKRRLNLNALQVASVQWTFVNDQFVGFRSFFDTTLQNGSLPFLIELHKEDKVAAFMGNYSSSHADNQIIVTGSLQIITQLNLFLALSGQHADEILLSGSAGRVLQSGVTYAG